MSNAISGRSFLIPPCILIPSGGISASLASLAWNHFYRRENVSSLGASGEILPSLTYFVFTSSSGAIMATLALYSCAFPRNTFLIFFVIPCPAWVFLPGVLIYDGWRSLSDQVCTLLGMDHMGGAAYFGSTGSVQRLIRQGTSGAFYLVLVTFCGKLLVADSSGSEIM